MHSFLLAPVISEKSTEVGDKRRTAVFRVAADASKEEIRAAVEKLFEVKVKQGGGSCRCGARANASADGSDSALPWKKAYVRLREGYDINFFGACNSNGVNQVNPTTPGQRNMVKVKTEGLHKGKPERALLMKKKRTAGAQHGRGESPCAHRGGGHKQRYRVIDFRRGKDGVPAVVRRLEYDPNRSAHLALLVYRDGDKRYILAPRDLKVGDVVESGVEAPIRPGNAKPLYGIPVGVKPALRRAVSGTGGAVGARRRVSASGFPPSMAIMRCCA